MARQPRIDLGGQVYHVINRASGRVPIFKNKSDFKLFEEVLEEAQKRENMRILSYCIMPNHFHLALYPKQDKDLQKFMGWLTKTHTQRWHVAHHTIGHGHLYQGRYKSFLVHNDAYYLALMKYIEQNPWRAKLVAKSEDWQWGSLHRRFAGTIEHKKLLYPWIVVQPRGYLADINRPLHKHLLDDLRTSVIKGSPLGGDAWRQGIIKSLNLEYTTRSVGRPKNGS